MSDAVFFTATIEAAFVQAGMVCPSDAEEGRNTRFSTNSDKHDKAGWLRWFPDGKGAAFGCWRDSTSFVWQQRLDGDPAPTGEALKRAKQQAAQARRQAEAERAELHAMTARMLLTEFAGLPDADAENAYCKRKGIVPPNGVKQGQRGQLVIPVFDGDGALQSVQDIFPDGRKQFAKDCRMKGGRFVFGELVDGNDITLTEGFSTGASVYESGIGAVVNCFCGANLAVVAAGLRKRYPNSFIRVAGDLDVHGKGAEYARAAVAAAMPNSDMVLPAFSDGQDHGDFNDLHQFDGLDAVRDQLEKTDRVGSDSSPSNDAGDTDLLPAALEFDAPSLAVADVRDGTATTRPLTEYGNALRILDNCGEHLRFAPEVRGWLVWRDAAWTWDTTGAHVRETAAALAPAIYSEGAAFPMAMAEYFAKWARATQTELRVNSAVAMLSDMGRVRLPLSAVDADPMLIGFDHARQVIDLQTGLARPAAPGDYVTKSLTPCAMGDASKAVRWHSFLDQIFNGDVELIDWLHRWCGYLLTGSTQEQIFLFFFGLGANGKSVFAELIRYVLGDYARTVAAETLTETKRQGGAASPDLADLIGCRLALTTETEDGSALAESLVKALTGGDSITARKLYHDPVAFTPAFKLLMLGNHRPIIRGTDFGIWRRVRLVPFSRIFAEDERDTHLLDKLKAESNHILAWMVQGCIAWQHKGLADVPAAIANQTAEYRQEQDVIGQWLAECTKADRTAETDTGEVYTSYRNWALDSGLKPASKVSIGRRLSERGFYNRKSHGKRIWVGITLNAKNSGGYSDVY